MIELTEVEMQDEMARARAALAKLGVQLDEPIEERTLAAIVKWWCERKTPPAVGEIATGLGVPRAALNYALAKLRADGRVLNPRRGLWVPAPDEVPPLAER